MDILRDMNKYFRGFEHIVPMLTDLFITDKKRDDLKYELCKMPGINAKTVTALARNAGNKNDVFLLSSE